MSSRNSLYNTNNSYESAVQDLEQEKKMVAALKRLSIGNMMSYDPDLPSEDIDQYQFKEESPGSGSPRNRHRSNLSRSSSLKNSYDNQSIITTDLTDEFFDAEDNDQIYDSSNSLLWVPANLHPEVDPDKFKMHIKNTVEEIMERKSNKRSSLSRSSSISDNTITSADSNATLDEDAVAAANAKKRESFHQNNRFSNPSLRELSSELEKLSKMAGMDATDAVTLARTLSTNSLGYTDVEKLAMDELSSPHTSMRNRADGDSDDDDDDPESPTDTQILPWANFQKSLQPSSTLHLQERLQQQFQETQRERDRESEEGEHSLDGPFASDRAAQDFALKRSRRPDYRKTGVINPSSPKPGKLEELRNNLHASFNESVNGDNEADAMALKKKNSKRMRDSQFLFSYRNPNEPVAKDKEEVKVTTREREARSEIDKDEELPVPSLETSPKEVKPTEDTSKSRGATSKPKEEIPKTREDNSNIRDGREITKERRLRVQAQSAQLQPQQQLQHQGQSRQRQQVPHVHSQHRSQKQSPPNQTQQAQLAHLQQQAQLQQYQQQQNKQHQNQQHQSHQHQNQHQNQVQQKQQFQHHQQRQLQNAPQKRVVSPTNRIPSSTSSTSLEAYEDSPYGAAHTRSPVEQQLQKYGQSTVAAKRTSQMKSTQNNIQDHLQYQDTRPRQTMPGLFPVENTRKAQERQERHERHEKQRRERHALQQAQQAQQAQQNRPQQGRSPTSQQYPGVQRQNDQQQRPNEHQMNHHRQNQPQQLNVQVHQAPRGSQQRKGGSLRPVQQSVPHRQSAPQLQPQPQQQQQQQQYPQQKHPLHQLPQAQYNQQHPSNQLPNGTPTLDPEPRRHHHRSHKKAETQKTLHLPYVTTPTVKNKSQQLNQNLDLLRSEINEFKESLNKNDTLDEPTTGTTYNFKKVPVSESALSENVDSDFSFELSYQDISYEDSLGIEKEVLQGLGVDILSEIDVKGTRHDINNNRTTNNNEVSDVNDSMLMTGVKLQSPPRQYRHQTLAPKPTSSSFQSKIVVGNEIQGVPTSFNVTEPSAYPSPTVQYTEVVVKKPFDEEVEYVDIDDVDDIDGKTLRKSQDTHELTLAQVIETIEQAPSIETSPTKIRKKKSFGILQNNSTEKKLKKKKSWPWLKERSSSLSSADVANLPPVPESVRSVSTPVAQSDDESENKKDKVRNGDKENMISKLFKRKKVEQTPDVVAPVHNVEPNGVTLDYESDTEKKAKKLGSSLFKKKSRRNLVKERETRLPSPVAEKFTLEDASPVSVDLRSSAEKEHELRPHEQLQQLQQEDDIAVDRDAAFNTNDELESSVDSQLLDSPKEEVSGENIDSKRKKPKKKSKSKLEESLQEEADVAKEEDDVKPQTTLDVQEKLKKVIKRSSRANQPIEFTDSAFGFPLPPPSQSTLVMLDFRFPVHVERAIYRLSHLKLANPKRSLREQVLLSNFMYAYLNLVDHTLHLEQHLNNVNESSIQEEEMGSEENGENDDMFGNDGYHDDGDVEDKVEVLDSDDLDDVVRRDPIGLDLDIENINTTVIEV